jgi:hypothetical protein
MTQSISETKVISAKQPIMAYELVVTNGVIQLPFHLPDGVHVYILVPAVPSQIATGSVEWQQALNEFEDYAREHPTTATLDELSDLELDAIIHEVRRDAHAA